ncbi:TauD/TfdA family dioxygenase [Nocardia sp. NPDC003482]
MTRDDPALLPDLRAHFDASVLGVPVLPGTPAPLLLTPTRPEPSWTARLGRALADELLRRPALLLRRTGIESPADFARLADTVLADMPVYRTGEHPAVRAGAGEVVYEPVRFAATETLLWHHEDSFARQWPRFVLFACLRPALTGGHTTLVDTRLVYRDTPEPVRNRLHRIGIRYERFCDGHAGRSWQQLYSTDNPHHAQRAAAARDELLEFTAQGARITFHRAAFTRPGGHPTWFNQILHWHPAALPTDLRELTTHNLVPTYRRCTAGDGTPITDDIVDALIRTHTRHHYPLAWQPGDVLLIDNAVLAHGRAPFTGPRRHLVRMAGIGTHPSPERP